MTSDPNKGAHIVHAIGRSFQNIDLEVYIMRVASVHTHTVHDDDQSAVS